MVYMGMCQKNIIHGCRTDRKLRIFKHIDALLHTIINEYGLSTRL